MNAESNCISNDSQKGSVAKYTAKDSVFTNLFSDSKYLLQLYRALHPDKPELYVIYTGSRKTRPEYLRLSEEFWSGGEYAVEVKVKMIYDGEKGDIISQYISFTRIYNEQIKLYGRTRKAVLETIRICRDRNILREYLRAREQEVVNIMMTLFDEEYILKTYIEQEKREATEEAERKANEAAKEAAKQATQKALKETAKKLYQKGTSVADIADAMSMPENEVKQWLRLISR